jgi:hypothetical protein
LTAHTIDKEMNMRDDLLWIENWYQAQCDGDWEHEFGITIETVDNPGWYLTINLTNTNLENVEFEFMKEEKSEQGLVFLPQKRREF